MFKHVILFFEQVKPCRQNSIRYSPRVIHHLKTQTTVRRLCRIFILDRMFF